MELKPLTEDEIESIVSSAVSEAVDFIESEIQPERVKSQKYFDGQSDLEYEDGRSKVVSTKCRDVVRALKPSLMRVFLDSQSPVEFIPTGPEDVASATQCTQFINYKFNQLNGYKVLSDVFQDALVKRVGICRAYYEDYSTTEVHKYSGLADEEFNYLVSDESVEVLEHGQTVEFEIDTTTGTETEKSVHEVKIARKKEAGDICIESVPPEEFFVDRNAKDLDKNFYVVGHRVEKTVGELVEAGYEFEDVVDLGGLSDNTTSDTEQYARSGYSIDRDEGQNNTDPSSRKVLITEAYMKIDVDGTGYPLLHRIIMGGTSYKMLDHMPCDHHGFATFCPDPEPHTLWGRSLVGLLFDDQDASTSVVRSILDNVALVNTPRLQIVESQANINDALNNEIGAIIRTRAPGAVSPIAIPFVAGQTLSALQYLDQMIEQKSGVSSLSAGMNADVLQSTTKQAVDHHISSAQGQTEIIARNFAEGGMKELFRILLQLTIKHSFKEEIMRLNNQFVPVDVKSWNAEMDMTCNVGLGTGKEAEKQQALQQTLQIQQMLYQQYGPQNGLVNLTQIINTLADILASAGMRNTERYFQPMTLEQEQMMQQQAQQAQQAQAQAPQPMDPSQAILQGEQIKAQSKQQGDMMKLQLQAQKNMMDDDRARDKMDQDLLVKSAELLAKHGAQINVAQIKSAQAGLRQPGGEKQ